MVVQVRGSWYFVFVFLVLGGFFASVRALAEALFSAFGEAFNSNAHSKEAAGETERAVTGVPSAFALVRRVAAFAASVWHGFLLFAASVVSLLF